jgi:hypothetical protein
MEPNKDQPKADVKKNVAALARVNRLNKFDDLFLIEKFATKFSQDPDRVYDETSFGTIINFHILWKEQEEYNERYQSIWAEVNTPPSK